MQIVKKINNNVAIGIDDAGKECVVFGKGIGFPATPYELVETEKISRIFKDVDAHIAMALENISDAALLAASDIVDLAKVELDRANLSPALAFTLADHLQFAVRREGEGVYTAAPFGADVQFVYPKEWEIGRYGLGIVKQRMGFELSENEAAAIALHIVAANGGDDNPEALHLVMQTTHLIEKASEIVENEFNRKIDKASYAYIRFAAHFRFLVSRLQEGGEVVSDNNKLFDQAAIDFPEIYSCAQKIDNLLFKTAGWRCSNEELLYLMMHINRLVSN